LFVFSFLFTTFAEPEARNGNFIVPVSPLVLLIFRVARTHAARMCSRRDEGWGRGGAPVDAWFGFEVCDDDAGTNLALRECHDTSHARREEEEGFFMS